MGRWTDDDDDFALPHGMKRVGYDADEQVYYYQDASGKTYRGQPGSRYGRLNPVPRRERHSYPDAKSYLKAHEKHHSGGTPNDADSTTTLAEIIKSAGGTLSRALSNSGSSRPRSSSAFTSTSTKNYELPTDVRDFLDCKETATTQPSATGSSRFRSNSAVMFSQIPDYARRLSRRLTLRLSTAEIDVEARHVEKAESRSANETRASYGREERASRPARPPQRAQTVREYIEHGRDEKKSPPRAVRRSQLDPDRPRRSKSVR